MLETILNHSYDMNFSSYPEVEKILSQKLTSKEKEEINTILSTIHKEEIYKGLIHGLYHSEKVLLYTYLIIKEKGIQEPYKTVALDAAIYHDIGRENNVEDEFHGYTSAQKIDGIIQNNPIYQHSYNEIILKAVIDAHSRSDGKEINSFDNFAYEAGLLTENDKRYLDAKKVFIVLASVLKDADALDRKRFGEGTFESLREECLRLKDISPDLVVFAEQLNELYYTLMKAQYSDIDESQIPFGTCYHSVGFDFFKINSVLTHGVLSQDEMRKRLLKVPRNFSGGNFDRWISVVDISLVKYNATGLREFINHGVSFLCTNVKMHKPCADRERESALEKGLPWNKSGHDDERYVQGRIAPEQIESVNIPLSYLHTSLLDLKYLYNSTDIRLLEDRVNYYITKTDTPKDSPLLKNLDSYLETYGQEVSKYLRLSQSERKKMNLRDILEPILTRINQIVANMMFHYYAHHISFQDKITVYDAVSYELSLNKSIHYQYLQSANHGYFVLNGGDEKQATKAY